VHKSPAEAPLPAGAVDLNAARTRRSKRYLTVPDHIGRMIDKEVTDPSLSCFWREMVGSCTLTHVGASLYKLTATTKPVMCHECKAMTEDEWVRGILSLLLLTLKGVETGKLCKVRT